MAIVVSDTSPIRALNHLGLLAILPALYGQIYIPDAVAVELRQPGKRFQPLNPASISQVIIQSPQDLARVAQLQQILDAGESAAIVLALELHADRLLIDERDGRKEAQNLGLSIIGVLGVLLEAKGKGLIPALRPLIDRLQTQLDFRLSTALISKTLLIAGE